jgi:hypothetical protein
MTAPYVANAVMTMYRGYNASNPYAPLNTTPYAENVPGFLKAGMHAGIFGFTPPGTQEVHWTNTLIVPSDYDMHSAYDSELNTFDETSGDTVIVQDYPIAGMVCAFVVVDVSVRARGTPAEYLNVLLDRARPNYGPAVYTVSGTFIAPATAINVQAWGSGGKGGVTGNGGGGGGYAAGAITGLTIGQAYAVHVAVAGDEGASYFIDSSIVEAASGMNGDNGGAGGSGTGSTVYDGGHGYQTTSYPGGGGGGAAGAQGNGVNGTDAATANGGPSGPGAPDYQGNFPNTSYGGNSAAAGVNANGVTDEWDGNNDGNAGPNGGLGIACGGGGAGSGPPGTGGPGLVILTW